jgi:hypothetical protein
MRASARARTSRPRERRWRYGMVLHLKTSKLMREPGQRGDRRPQKPAIA